MNYVSKNIKVILPFVVIIAPAMIAGAIILMKMLLFVLFYSIYVINSL